MGIQIYVYVRHVSRLSDSCSLRPSSRRGGPRWRRIWPAHASGGLLPLISKPNSPEEMSLFYPKLIPLNIPRCNPDEVGDPGSAAR